MNEVIINGRFLTQEITGVQRYAHELMRHLDQLLIDGQIDSDQYSIILAVPPNTRDIPKYQRIKVKCIGYLQNNLWEQISLPLFARKKILFSPCNIAPIFGGDRQLLTIHDASVFGYPKTYTPMFLLKYRFILKTMGEIARIIFTDSDFSKKELMKYCSIPTEKIVVVPLGHEHILEIAADERILKKYNLSQRPYLFTVGSQSAHKNYKGVMLATNSIEKKDFDLIVAGGTFSKVFKNMDASPDPTYVNLGYVNDQELRALYEHAACFIYASFYEGFGLPPLEAMACGCPVIASDIPALREVCGDVAVYCDPNNPDDIKKIIQAVLSNADLMNKMKCAGIKQAQKFNWEYTTIQIWDKITSMID
ncbi:MAG TPA: glycosyltransferase family 1 protein [Clostridiales bacterium]|jgi:glycosyltransferase involved in cell wall biosynthesis|nr:glycosyltransferase family 1 protein [Clostridiales bacterium]